MKYKRIFAFTAALLMLGVFFTQPVEARAKTSGSSAALLATAVPTIEDRRVEVLTAFLESYNSPMSGSAKTFIEEADKNNLDWKLVVSIAGVESWFGQKIPYQSNNAWGWGVYGDNVIHFVSWDAGISTVSTALRTNYMDRWGATNVYEIGSYYAADKAWAQKVSSFMTRLENFENDYTSTKLSISI